MAQMYILKEDKEHSAQEVRQLSSNLEELRSQLEEPSPPQPSAEPTQVEQQLRKELEVQVQENKSLSHLAGRATAPAGAARGWNERHEEHGEPSSHPGTLTDWIPVPKEQLAQLQDENMKLTITLQVKQNVKELAKKLDQLQ
jgi:hypothetical protein